MDLTGSAPRCEEIGKKNFAKPTTRSGFDGVASLFLKYCQDDGTESINYSLR